MSKPDYGKVAYEAYAQHQDVPMPWDSLSQSSKNAWFYAAFSAIEAFEDYVKAQGEAAWQTSQPS